MTEESHAESNVSALLEETITSGFGDSNEGKDGVLTAESEGDSIRVSWNVNNPRPRDWLGLYIHERTHENHFIASYQTEGKQSGEVVFTGLVRGYYDVRFFEDGSYVRAPGFNVCVVCVGSPVRLSVTRPNRKTLVVSWPPEYTDSGNWIALFRADEHGNRARNTIAHKLMKEAETAIAPKPRLLLPCPRSPGDYHVRFFFKGSLTLDPTSTNAYSGIAYVSVPNEDDMVAKIDRTRLSLSVAWKAYSVEPNKNQWIGLYANSEPSAKRLTWEYVCYHPFTSADHDEGIIVFTEPPSELKECIASGVISPVVRSYELRFFNSYSASSTPLFCRPCKFSL